MIDKNIMSIRYVYIRNDGKDLEILLSVVFFSSLVLLLPQNAIGNTQNLERARQTEYSAHYRFSHLCAFLLPATDDRTTRWFGFNKTNERKVLKMLQWSGMQT